MESAPHVDFERGSTRNVDRGRAERAAGSSDGTGLRFRGGMEASQCAQKAFESSKGMPRHAKALRHQPSEALFSHFLSCLAFQGFQDGHLKICMPALGRHMAQKAAPEERNRLKLY